MSAELKKFAKDTIIYGLGTVGTRLLSFILIPLYIRYLTTSNYGILEIFSVSIMFATIFLKFGIENALSRFYFDSDNPDERGKVIFTSLTFLTISSLLLCSLAYIFSDAISLQFIKHTGYASFIRVTAVTIFFSVVSIVPTQLFMLNKESKSISIINIGYFIGGFILNIVFVAILKKGTYGILLGNMYLIIITTIVTFYIKRHSLGISFSKLVLTKILSYSFPFIFVGLSFWIINFVDRYFILYFTSSHELGIYSIANRFAQIIMMVVSTIQIGLYPFAYSVIKNENAKEMFGLIFRIYVTFMGMILIVLSFSLKYMFRIILTPDFYPPESAVLILAVAFIFFGAYNIFFIGSGIAKKSSGVAMLTGLAAVVNTISNFLLIPKYGLMGASYSTLIAYALMALLMLIYSQRHYKINFQFKSVAVNILIISILISLGRVIDSTGISLTYNIPIKIILIFVYLSFILILINQEKSSQFLSVIKK